MELTEQQQLVLEHARDMLADERDAHGLGDAEWRRALRLTLRDVVEAFASELP